MYLYSLATSNSELQRFSSLMFTMELQAVQFYWHMASDGSSAAEGVYDMPLSGKKMIGNVGAFDVTVSTWFGTDIEYVHGINM